MPDYNERECGYEDCGEFFEPVVHNQAYCSAECKRSQRAVRERRETRQELREIVDDPKRVEFLRKENKRLENLYLKHKYQKDEYIHSIHEAAYEAMSEMRIPRSKAPKIPTLGEGDPEVCNPVLSDFQLGKVTPSYDKEVCRERISDYAEKVVEITNKERADHPVDHCRVHILGDIVEGEDIFPGQSHEIDTSLYRQITTAVEILSEFLNTMLANFETVHVVCVYGNHGRIGRRGQFDPETNMDRLAYKFVSMLFDDEPRISFDIPDSDDGPGKNYYTVDTVGDYSVLLIHGDQLPRPSTTPSYFKKILGWKTSGMREDFDDVIQGHWHQNTKLTFGKTVVRIVGSPESDNLFAQERLGVMGRPSQHLQFIHPSQGVTGEYDIYLD